MHPQLVVLGDFNIAPDDRDVHDPSIWHDGHILSSTAERAALRRHRTTWACTTVSACTTPRADSIRWWDYRLAGYRRNSGLRIDLMLVSEALRGRAVASGIDLRAAHLGAAQRSHAGVGAGRPSAGAHTISAGSAVPRVTSDFRPLPMRDSSDGSSPPLVAFGVTRVAMTCDGAVGGTHRGRGSARVRAFDALAAATTATLARGAIGIGTSREHGRRRGGGDRCRRDRRCRGLARRTRTALGAAPDTAGGTRAAATGAA